MPSTQFDFRQGKARAATDPMNDTASNSSKIAIAFQAPLTPSETFIRRHIEALAPGKTAALLCGGSAEPFAHVPSVHLSNGREHEPYIARKVLGLQSLMRTGSTLTVDKISEERALSFLRKCGTQAILAEYGPIGCAVRRIALRAQIKLFVHFHGYDASSALRRRHNRREYIALFASAAGIIAPSNFIASRLQEAGCPASKLHVVPCGVDVEQFTPRSSGQQTKRFLAVGRFVPKKAPQVTIQAFKQTLTLHPDAELRMVGDGPLLGICHSMVAELRLSGKVQLLGRQTHEQVRELMKESDIFIQHSVTAPDGDTEGMPVAILEAMASGMPVVSTYHSGIPEAVINTETGLLAGEYDAVAMAHAMCSLADDPGKACAMGRAGRERVVREFSAQRSITLLRFVVCGIEEKPPIAEPCSIGS
jgi:glycosyltransferase involved in cell wall biosynthesis